MHLSMQSFKPPPPSPPTSLRHLTVVYAWGIWTLPGWNEELEPVEYTRRLKFESPLWWANGSEEHFCIAMMLTSKNQTGAPETLLNSETHKELKIAQYKLCLGVAFECGILPEWAETWTNQYVWNNYYDLGPMKITGSSKNIWILKQTKSSIRFWQC